jgi:hypothetical protein
MAKTSAQRQADYRSRRNDGEGTRRISTWISVRADFALQRLARHHGTSQREMIERLAIQTDDEMLKSLDLDSPEWNQYLGVTR